jgi:hypothetical protein
MAPNGGAQPGSGLTWAMCVADDRVVSIEVEFRMRIVPG